MRGEVFAVSWSVKEGVSDADRGGEIPPLAGRVEGRQRLKGVRANSKF